jgi:hypothetical protein
VSSTVTAQARSSLADRSLCPVGRSPVGQIRPEGIRTAPPPLDHVLSDIADGHDRRRTISLGIVLIYTVSNRFGGWSSTKRADLAGWTAVVDPC